MQGYFLSDGSDFRSRSGGGYLAKHSKNTGLFWWTILITLLLGLAIFCWFFSIMVFKYPEKPFNYSLLTRLKKLEPIIAFTPQKVPHGKFYGAKELLARYYYFNTEQLRHTNEDLKRDYIRSYAEEAPVYAKGTYTVIQTRQLAEGDVFASGWVVRGRSVDMEDVHVELLLPGAEISEPPYKEGEAFTLDNKTTFTTVLHVDRTANDGMCLTLVPIVYGDYAVGGDQRVALSPPETINVKSTWPVIQVDDNANVNAATKVAAKSEP
jgi:hypothetical protein